jgi:hypothetical protein
VFAIRQIGVSLFEHRFAARKGGSGLAQQRDSLAKLC